MMVAKFLVIFIRSCSFGRNRVVSISDCWIGFTESEHVEKLHRRLLGVLTNTGFIGGTTEDKTGVGKFNLEIQDEISSTYKLR